MTINVNIQEAQAQLSHLLAQASAGEEVIIHLRDGGQGFQLVPVENTLPATRQLGQFKGQVHVPPEFFEPMSEEELALWYDAPLCSNDVAESD